ncbi:MAG: cryptochrome/photolyase family protein [Sporichthyaceae bacterium]
MSTTVMWFRRDLRLSDNPALLTAAGQGGLGGGPSAVVPLFVLDPALWGPAGQARRAYLRASLADLGERTGGLVIRHGDPVAEVVATARAAGATAVHVAADFGPYGRRRDQAVEKALAAHDIALVRTGSPYAVAPGRLSTGAGEHYKVFTPFYRAWLVHGWREATRAPSGVDWAHPLKSQPLPAPHDEPPVRGAGEAAARRRWHRFRDEALGEYAVARDRPDLTGTSGLSRALKYGEIHPRTLLTDLAELGFDRDSKDKSGAATFAKEVAWREFWADVLFHLPHTAREYLRPEFTQMRYDSPREEFTAWCEGRTGFPLVDAGMRQLRADGWMHNRVRMVVASFLIKDLHIEWQHGAREFMRHLADGDLASNQLSWQWVAGCGTDAAPYFRIFNPVGQGLKFDPDGEYVRRYIPELRHLDGAAAHQPWDAADGYERGYPERIVDHANERAEALIRLAEIKSSAT